MAGLVDFRPQKNPTPSMTIARMARYLPRLERISCNVDFFSIFPSYHSMSSTGVMCSFFSTEEMCPFLM